MIPPNRIPGRQRYNVNHVEGWQAKHPRRQSRVGADNLCPRGTTYKKFFFLLLRESDTRKIGECFGWLMPGDEETGGSGQISNHVEVCHEVCTGEGFRRIYLGVLSSVENFCI